jgi:hypothetical protein
MSRLPWVVAAAIAALVVSAGAQPTARITSPVDGTYLTGPVRLAIAFDPMSIAADVRQVRWFADGRLVCTAEAAPFSCEWDAGGRVDEHVIRAVAVLRADRNSSSTCGPERSSTPRRWTSTSCR